MPRPPKRQCTVPTEEWQQLELLFTSLEQRIYEQVRPVVLFGVPPRERAKDVGVSERTLYRQAERFTVRGMRSLFGSESLPHRRYLPEAIRTAVARLHAEYPSLHLREIATICYVRFGRKRSHKTVKRILAEPPSLTTFERRYPTFHQMEPETRRIAIIRLHGEGWHLKSIAGYLQTSRQTVHTTLNRWIEKGVRGLPNVPHAPTHPRRKVTLATLTTIRRLGRNPGLGAWRVHAALLREGIRLSPRTCGRMLALNRELYHVPKPEPKPHEPKPMPFRARHRHQSWQNYIETMFNVQRRMADYEFERATTWNELQAAHDRWVTSYNHEVHWAHQQRDDGRETPAEVLDWVYGTVWDEGALHYAFYATHFGRQLDRAGYVRFRHYRLYAEPGLERRRVAVWLYKEQRSVEFNESLLVQYSVTYQPDHKHFRSVTHPRLYETPHRSPQLPLWTFGDDEWLKVLRVPPVSTRKKRVVNGTLQPSFLDDA